MVLLMVLVLALAGATTVRAQSASNTLTGLATVHLGQAAGGDIVDRGWTPGGSLSVIEASGFGAEIDVSHTRQFNNARFRDSSVTTFMINAVGMWGTPDRMFRPYGLGGAGLMRARGCFTSCASAVTHTEVGFDAGAGLYVFVNDFLAARADLRYFRYLQRHADLPLTDGGYFDFWRSSIGVTLSWEIR